jgi:hypothetical protein
MGDKTFSFVEKSCNYAAQNSTLVPPYMDVKAFQKDLNLVHELISLKSTTRQALDFLEEIRTGAGCNAYMHARAFYHTVKNAAMQKVPGAKAIYEELKCRYPGHKQRNENSAAAPEPSVEQVQ